MKLWIFEAWRKYSNLEIQNDTKFVIDDASMLKIKNIFTKKFNDCDIKINMIPARYFQPFDISINKPLKNEL